MLKFLFSTILVVEVFGRGKIIPDDRMQYCNGPPLKPGEPARGNFSIVDLDYLVTDDEVVSINGTVTTTKFTSKLRIRSTGEQLLQGDWHPRSVKVMEDACFDLFNPLDIFYPYYKDQQRCPYNPGVSFLKFHHKINLKTVKFQDQVVFRDVILDVSYMYWPPSYQGRWRVKMEGELELENGEKLKDCYMNYGDLVVD